MYFCSVMAERAKNKPRARKAVAVKVPAKKKVSKTWLAVLKNKQNPGIEIVDMRAVLK